MNMERPRSEFEPKKENPRRELLEIYDAEDGADVDVLSRTIETSEKELADLADRIGGAKIKENLDWLSGNNDRINLYNIAATLNGEPCDKDGDEMNADKAKQLLCYRKIKAALLTAGETNASAGSQLLSDFIKKNRSLPYLCGAAVEALAKNNSLEARRSLQEIVDDQKLGFETRSSAVLAGLREGVRFEDNMVVDLLKDRIVSLGENLCDSEDTYKIIEILGLLAGDLARVMLDELWEKMKISPQEKIKWFLGDVISTGLSLADDKNEYLKKTLNENGFAVCEGIFFGSQDDGLDLNDFSTRNKNKLAKIAKAVTRINSAFKSEPVLFVDIRSGGNEAGWTQNSIYFSRDYIEKSDIVDDLAQVAGHEACERWQSKGFVDVQLAKYYLQLMGDQFAGSGLEKFRLKNRLSNGSGAGHPWDGEREFIAELGGTLLVDPEKISELFDANKDKTCLKALEYLKKKLELA